MVLRRSEPRRKEGRREGPGTIRGHLEALAAAARQLAKPPITMPLAAAVDARHPSYRGFILFYYDKCIGCSLCAQICPSRAIKMYKVPGDKRIRPGYDVGRCIFCGLCVDICPVDALGLSLIHDKVYEDVPSMDMDPVEWAVVSRKLLEEEASPGKPALRAVVDPERGLRYERVEPRRESPVFP